MSWRWTCWPLASIAAISIGMGIIAGCQDDSAPDQEPSPPVTASPLPTAEPTPSASPVPAAFDRGVSYDAVYFEPDVARDKVEADLDALVQIGVNSIYLTTSEEDASDPRKVDLILEAAHARKLRVYLNPYIGGTFSGDEGQSAEAYLGQHPEDEMISRLGGGSGLPTLISPAYRTYLKDTLASLLTREFDGVLLDEPFFPQGTVEDYYPYDEASRAKFARMFGHEMPAAEDDEVIAFRQTAMLEFLTELFGFIEVTKPEATRILVVLPDFGGRDFVGTGDWRSLSRIPGLDVFQIDPYWYDRGWEWFVQNIEQLERETAGAQSITGVWVQAYGMTGDYGRITQTLQYLKEKGVPSLAAWVTPDVLPNDDMAATWEAIGEVYLQGQGQ